LACSIIRPEVQNSSFIFLGFLSPLFIHVGVHLNLPHHTNTKLALQDFPSFFLAFVYVISSLLLLLNFKSKWHFCPLPSIPSTHAYPHPVQQVLTTTTVSLLTLEKWRPPRRRCHCRTTRCQARPPTRGACRGPSAHSSGCSRSCCCSPPCPASLAACAQRMRRGATSGTTARGWRPPADGDAGGRERLGGRSGQPKPRRRPRSRLRRRYLNRDRLLFSGFLLFFAAVLQVSSMIVGKTNKKTKDTYMPM
jgi:hypothetical protein